MWKVIVGGLTFLTLAGGATGYLNDWFGWGRPWVKPVELQAVQVAAEAARDWGVKSYQNGLVTDQRYLDDQRKEFSEKKIPVPQYLQERQHELDRRKCEFEQLLLPPAVRKPCY